MSPEELLQKLAQEQIRAVKFGKDLVRFVTHYDFGQAELEEFETRISKL